MATLTLDSPHNRNALSTALMTELLDALAAAVADTAVRVVVLTHTGPVFCSGADLKETAAAYAGGHGAGRRGWATCWPRSGSARSRWWRGSAGPARAGGLGLIAAADIAVCADDGDVRLHRGAARRDPGGDLGDRAAPAAPRAPPPSCT